MAYMRGGSSFFGSTFSMNRGVFYWYEPLWDLYNAMAAVPPMTYVLHTLYNPDGHQR